MYVVFARKYRPMRFEDVVGQDHVTRTLRNAVEGDRVAHAYLFCGSRGVGKTTVARILAKALNCENGPTPEPCCACDACKRIATGDDIDVMEIDGASNRGIDEVRELRQNARLVPSRSRFKIYYIDEVHMLTDPAFNALLKTLEEPPSHVKFIFSTTDPQKLPETIKSRCQRFDFRRIDDADLVKGLESVCSQEGLEVEAGGLGLVARAARGSMRDALGTLDQLAAFGSKISQSDVLGVLGAVDQQSLVDLVDALAQESTADALGALHRIIAGGADVEDVADQISQHLRDLTVASFCGVDDPLLAGSAAEAQTLERQAGLFSPEQFTYMIQVLREAKLRARRDTTGRVALELGVIKLSRLSQLVPVQEALDALAGSGTVPPQSRQPQGSPRQGSPEPQPNQAVSRTLARMREKVKNGPPRAQTGAPAEPAPTPEALPEGMNGTRYRQLLACAEDPDAAREALAEKPLMKAFVEGDHELSLDPVRLERHRQEDEEAEAEEPSEVEEEE